MDLRNTKKKHRELAQRDVPDEQSDTDDSSLREESNLPSICSNNKDLNDFLRWPKPTTSYGDEVSKDESLTLRPINSAPTPNHGLSHQRRVLGAEAKSCERKQRSDRTHSSSQSRLPPVSSQHVVGHDWRKNLDDTCVESRPAFVRGKLDYPVNKSPCFKRDEYTMQSSPKVQESKDLHMQNSYLLSKYTQPLQLQPSESKEEADEDKTKFLLPSGGSDFRNVKNKSLFTELWSPQADVYQHEGNIQSYRSTYSSGINAISMHGDGLNYTIFPVCGGNSSPARLSHRSSSTRTSYGTGSQKSRRESPVRDVNTALRCESKQQKHPESRHISLKEFNRESDLSSLSTLHGPDNPEDELHREHRIHRTIQSRHENVPSSYCPKTETNHKKYSVKGEIKTANYLDTSIVTNSYQPSKCLNVKLKPDSKSSTSNKDKTHGEDSSTSNNSRHSSASSPKVPGKTGTHNFHPKLKTNGSSNRSSKSPTITVPVHKRATQIKPKEKSFTSKTTFHTSSRHVDECPSSLLSVKIKAIDKQSQGDIFKKADDLLYNVYNGHDRIEILNLKNTKDRPPINTLLNNSTLNTSSGDLSSMETTISDDSSSCTLTLSPHWDDDMDNLSLVAATRDTDLEVGTERSSARSRRRARTTPSSSPASHVMISPSFQDVLPMQHETCMCDPVVEPTVDCVGHGYNIMGNSTAMPNVYEIQVLPRELLQTFDEAADNDLCMLKENIARYAEPFKKSPTVKSSRIMPIDTSNWDKPPKYVKPIRPQSTSPVRICLSPQQQQKRNVQSARYGDCLQTHDLSSNGLDRTQESQLARHISRLQIDAAQNAQRSDKHITCTESNGKLDSHSKIHDTSQKGSSQIHATSSAGHTREFEATKLYKPNRKEHETIDSVKQAPAPPPTQTPSPRTPPPNPCRKENDNLDESNPTIANVMGSARIIPEEPLDLCLNVPHSPLHYTAVMQTIRKKIGLNEIGHTDLYDLVKEQRSNYGIQPSTSYTSSFSTGERERKTLSKTSPLSLNKCKQATQMMLKSDSQGQTYPFNIPYELETQYSSPTSIVEVAIALKHTRSIMQTAKTPSMIIEERLTRRGIVVDGMNFSFGETGNEVIEIKKPRTACITQSCHESDESDNNSSTYGNKSITEPTVEEENCICLRACWKAVLFFFFNVRS